MLTRCCNRQASAPVARVSSRRSTRVISPRVNRKLIYIWRCSQNGVADISCWLLSGTIGDFCDGALARSDDQTRDRSRVRTFTKVNLFFEGDADLRGPLTAGKLSRKFTSANCSNVRKPSLPSSQVERQPCFPTYACPRLTNSNRSRHPDRRTMRPTELEIGTPRRTRQSTIPW